MSVRWIAPVFALAVQEPPHRDQDHHYQENSKDIDCRSIRYGRNARRMVHVAFLNHAMLAPGGTFDRKTNPAKV
jgi:hypothetical protein